MKLGTGFGPGTDDVVFVEGVRGLFTQMGFTQMESVARPKESISYVFVVVVFLLIHVLLLPTFVISYVFVVAVLLINLPFLFLLPTTFTFDI